MRDARRGRATFGILVGGIGVIKFVRGVVPRPVAMPMGRAVASFPLHREPIEKHGRAHPTAPRTAYCALMSASLMSFAFVSNSLRSI